MSNGGKDKTESKEAGDGTATASEDRPTGELVSATHTKHSRVRLSSFNDTGR